MDLQDILTFLFLVTFIFGSVWYMEKKKGRIAFTLGGEQGETIGRIKGDGGKLMTAELAVHLLHQKNGTRTVLEFIEGGKLGGGKFRLFAGFDRNQIDEIIELLQKAKNET